MTRDEFIALPPGVALRVLFDCLDEETAEELRRFPVPELPKTPRYDYSIYRRDGVQFASETNTEGLTFWRNRAATSADSGSQYAAKDAKARDVLDKWIAWRSFFPDAIWAGERNSEATVAAPPSAKPRVYPKAGSARKPPPQQEAPAEDYYGTGGGNDAAPAGASDYDDVPF